MPCILKITDPLLKSILGKEEFKTFNELRETFDNVANSHSILPLNIKAGKEMTFRKFGKVYKEDGYKVQIVMPGQEYFNQFELNVPEQLSNVEDYGKHDNKILTFDSLDTFLSFYLANFLYVSDTNYASLTKSVTNILDQTGQRLSGRTSYKHAGAVEDLKFADSLIRYAKLLYEYAGQSEPAFLNEVYELILDKWNRYHQEKKEVSTVTSQAKKNVSELFKQELPKVPANIFFQAYDYIQGKENTKPLAQARRNLIKGITDPTKFRIKLVQGSVDQIQERGDTDYPTKAMIEGGVVAIVTDENDNPVYLTKDNKLTINPEQGIELEYEVEGEKKKSKIITLLFSNVHKPLKEEFLSANPEQRETYIFNIENTKFQIEEKVYQNFEEAGFQIKDIQINIISDDPFAGFAYVTKDNKQIIVDSTPLNEDEIGEVIKVLEHTYEPDELINVVDYLNDLLSVSAERVKKEKTGREIAFYPDQSTGKIMIHPFRIKTEEKYEEVQSEPIYYSENPELVKQSLRAARIRFRKNKDAGLKTSWDKYIIENDELKKVKIKDNEGEQFYLDHIKDIKVQEIRSSQIAAFTEKVIPKLDQPVKQYFGALEIVPGKTYTLGEIYQLAFLPLSNSTSEDSSNEIKQKELARKIWSEVYSKSDAKFVFREHEDVAKSPTMWYSPETKTISISPVKIKESKSAYLVNSLLEEVLHNITVNRIKKYNNTEEYKQLEQDYEKAKELLNTYKETDQYQKLDDLQKRDIDTLALYYTKNIEEFIVGISNPHFRWFLRLGESRDKNLLEQVIESVKKFLNIILKGEVPSLYTDVTTDLFEFISKKPTDLIVIEQTQQTTAPELITEQRKEKPKFQKRETKISKEYFAPPESSEVDMRTIEGLDAEISEVLFSSGVFGDFVQGNVSTDNVWDRYYNTLVDDYDNVDDERQAWIERFLEDEDILKKEWKEKSKLFKFNNEKIVINEDEIDLDDLEEAENPEEEQGKDVGYNRVDSEQKYSRLQLADAYAKIFIKMIPGPRVNGLTTLTDFTNLWNRLQNKLQNTLSYEEQINILSKSVKLIPESEIIIKRLESLPKDVNGSIIINSFQKSFSTAFVPTYNTYLTRTDQGLDYSFFQSPRLDIQNLEMSINQGFASFAEGIMTNVRLGDREIPTPDLNKLLNHLNSSKDLIKVYRELGFPIPEVDKNVFIRESGLQNFHTGFINIIKARIGKWNGGESKNTIISNNDLITFLKGKASWGEYGTLYESPGLATLTNRFISVLSEYSPITVSNMTKNAEGKNQSNLLSWSSFLINIKKLNDGETFREKNPIFKYSLISQLIDSNNQIEPINLSGIRVQEGDGWEGVVSMDENFLEYTRQQIANMMLNGTAEILRVETKQTSLGYKFDWNGLHPISLENFKTSAWETNVLNIYGGYLLGELERIQLEKENPVTYYSKYNRIKEEFHLFDFLSPKLKNNLLKGDPKETLKANKDQIKKELVKYINDKVQRFKDKLETQTGIPVTRNHPSFDIIQIQKMIREMGSNGFDNFLKGFITNLDIYQIEHIIIGHGELGQFDKFYKRSGSNISTGTPVVLNDPTLEVLNNTIDRQFQSRIPNGTSFVLKDDILEYDTENLEKDIIFSLKEYYKAFNIKKSDKEIENEAIDKAKKYKETNVADGQGFMTPDFGRLIMMTTGNWSHDREKGFWFLKIQYKKNKGIKLTDDEQRHYDKVNKEIETRGIFWFFPPLKMQYRGEFIKEGNVTLEGLDKFSLAWLWPDVVEGTTFESILNKMFEEGIDYGKFESGTKIATFLPDDLLNQIREGNVQIEIGSKHEIDLTYMKEQVKAADKFKDMMPMSTQARKLVLSNLKFDGKYLNDSIGESATKWKNSQAKISEQNVKEVMESISTDGEIDNRKLADQVQKELKKRELPQSLTSIFTLYGQPDYQRFEQALSPQLVETLIFSLLKNKVVKPKFSGEHYIQVASPLFERGGRDLNYYEIKDGKTQPAEFKVVLSGEFLKLLNVPEINDLAERKSTYKEMSRFEQLEWRRKKLNELLQTEKFVNDYRKELTVFSSRIPGQGYNSMDIQIVKEFLPTYLGPVLVPNPLATVKSGTDFDFDKLPTITPELTKEGKVSKSRVNQMLKAASNLILDPINFHRLVTPNTTDKIDVAIFNTLEALGEKEKGKKMTEPINSQVLDFVTHLNKWMATKMKDALGIGATNNTFYTLLQESDAKLNDTFTLVEDPKRGDLVVDVRFPFNRSEQAMSYPLLQDGTDKLEFVNEFINITVDVASNDAIGYTGLKRDNSALLLFLLENGVSFDDAFYFINQPIIFKYHQLLEQYQDQGETLSEARNNAIEELLGILTKAEGQNIPKKNIYTQINESIKKENFANLLSTIARKDEIDSKWNTPTQKEYLAYYLIGLEMANAMRQAQSYNNFDTSPSPNVLYSEARERSLGQIMQTGLFDVESIQQIHNDSVISHLNVHDAFKQISEQAFRIKRNENFTNVSLDMAEEIYNDKDRENFFKKFDNDYLLAILQNFGTIDKDKVESNLRGELAKQWREIKDEVKDLTISKYVVENHSTKTPYISLTLFLGLDQDAQTLDQIAKDLRVMLNSENKQVKQFAKDFIETGLYATGFTQSPVYYLKALPFEVINGYLKEAYDNYEKLSPLEQQRFIGLFADRFMFQRGMQFGQYWIILYKKVFNIKNLDFKTKQLKFNQEAWRYTDYKLSLEELNQPDITDMNQSITFQEHPSPNYQDRTGINAQADATIAFAVNFNSRGELRTKEEVTKKGKKYIPIDAKNKMVTPELVQRVVDELRSVNATTLNIAGNGIYEPGIGTQQEVDDFVFNLLEQVIAQYPIQSIRTGGQTGYDEAGAKAGIRLGIPTIVLAPKGWKFRDKTGTDISNEQKFKERFVSQPTQLEFTKGKKGIGEEISSYKDDLAYALTNPVFTSPTGSTWSRTWTSKQKEWRNYLSAGIQFEGKSYRDVEEAYQKNKSKYPIGEARDNFMLNLIEIKLRTYPKLIEEINKRGGLNYLTDSTHQPTKQNSHWETGGDNAFIKLLSQAYLNVTGQQSQPIQQPKQLDLFENKIFSETEIDIFNTNIPKLLKSIGFTIDSVTVEGNPLMGANEFDKDLFVKGGGKKENAVNRFGDETGIVIRPVENKNIKDNNGESPFIAFYGKGVTANNLGATGWYTVGGSFSQSKADEVNKVLFEVYSIMENKTEEQKDCDLDIPF